MKKTSKAIGLGLGLVAAVALAGCGGGPAAQTLTVKARDAFAFDPPTLAGQVGQTFNVTLENDGVLEHNFVIDEFSVSAGPIAGGQSAAPVSFTPSAAGTFTYYCNVPGHREAGMEGTLTISE